MTSTTPDRPVPSRLQPNRALADETPVRDAHCAVCADRLDEDPVRCGRCDAPHHPDCWAYNGGCAIFGCLEEPVAGRLPPAEVPGKGARPHEVSWWARSWFGCLVGCAGLNAALILVVVLGGQSRIPSSDIGLWQFLMICTVLLGFRAGGQIRSAWDPWLLYYGILGPGLVSNLVVGIPSYGLTLLYSPVIVAVSMIMVPVSLPCAILSGMFNDPERDPVARTSMLRLAGAVLVISVSFLLSWT